MALDPSNSSNSEQLALKGLRCSDMLRTRTNSEANQLCVLFWDTHVHPGIQVLPKNRRS